jgi:hypothetical protein
MPSLVQYIGSQIANIDYHHGQLTPIVGASHYQVLRANRSHPEFAEDYGWTYNHAPMLAYWRGQFYLQYLSDPVGESVPPGQTLLTRSRDGLHWDKPQVIFPVYDIPDGVYQGPPDAPLPPGSQSVMHQRMGFYTAPDGRLLTLGFYGICPNVYVGPNDGRGIGRVVREVHPDGTYGPIYFLRYNRHAGWNESNTHYPFYTQSPDAGFVSACNALLSNPLMTLQWWEEDRSPDGFYAVEGYKALCTYHLPDGRVAGLWKWSKTALSADEGQTWSPVQDAPSLIMAGAKVWGQRTPDGRYALLYNPSLSDCHRWPLAVVSSDDGLNYDDMLLVNGHVSPRRYAGQYKGFGLNYVRGIDEGNGVPPGDAFWVAYSMNKEDMWVSRIPTPLRYTVEQPVDDLFADMTPGGLVPDWNIHSGLWTPVEVVDGPQPGERSLCLSDADPYQAAQAERIFPAGRRVQVSFRLQAAQTTHGQLWIELADARSTTPVRLTLRDDGQVWVQMGCSMRPLWRYAAGEWLRVDISADAARQRYTLRINGQTLVDDGTFFKAVREIQRITFRSGPAPLEPNLDAEQDAGQDLPDADTPVPLARYYLGWLRANATESHDAQ